MDLGCSHEPERRVWESLGLIKDSQVSQCGFTYFYYDYLRNQLDLSHITKYNTIQ